MIKLYLVKGYAGIAQLVEHLTCNEDVAGSSPVSSSILSSESKVHDQREWKLCVSRLVSTAVLTSN